MNVFYVYTHSTYVGGDVFYVGKGKGRRAWARTGRSTEWTEVVSKFGLVVSLVKEGLNEDDAYSLEEDLITSYRMRGNNLVNKTNGGGGTSGWVCSESTKNKISRKRSIKTYCSNGMVFNSRLEAVSWLKSLGFKKASVTCISKACSGKSISSYGFAWSNKGVPATLYNRPDWPLMGCRIHRNKKTSFRDMSYSCLSTHWILHQQMLPHTRYSLNIIQYRLQMKT